METKWTIKAKQDTNHGWQTSDLLHHHLPTSQPPNADFFHSSKEDCYLQIQYCQVWWYRSDMPVASDRTAEFDALGYVDMDTY